MSVKNTRYTPLRRGPLLADGAGGTSERPASTERDRVLQVVGHRTEDIRLTGTGVDGTDMSAGEAAVYNFGPVDQASVGRYVFMAQSAASATAEPLGAIEYIVLEIREETAGVFKIDRVGDLDNTPAAGIWTNMAVAVYQTDSDTPGFATTDGDDDVCFSVLTATPAGVLAGLGATYIGGTPTAGDLVIVECRSDTTEVWSVTRIS